MKVLALVMVFVIAIMGQSAWTDTERDFKQLSSLIKNIGNENLSLSFSDLPIAGAYATSFFKSFKNVAITDIKIVSQANDIIVFQGTISVALQTLVAEFTIMGDLYARISDFPQISKSHVASAQKVLSNIPNDDYLNQNPVLPLNRLLPKNRFTLQSATFSNHPCSVLPMSKSVIANRKKLSRAISQRKSD